MSEAVIFLFLAVIIVGVLLLVIITVTKRSPKRLNTAKYQERWLNITNQMGEDPASLQMAILNADKLLDTALQERGVSGKSMGERLKNNPKLFRDINAVWTAHKLRNRIAHEHDIQLSKQTAQKALNAFKAALTDLGAF